MAHTGSHGIYVQQKVMRMVRAQTIESVVESKVRNFSRVSDCTAHKVQKHRLKFYFVKLHLSREIILERLYLMKETE
jgi:hypothetical protein